MAEVPTKHVINRIRSSYSQFSEKEKLIADYILENRDQIVHSTINQVADDLMVADATVFRFCKRLGFKGYQAMKIALASETVNPIQDIHETITENDTDLEITEKVFQANIRALEASRDIQNHESLAKAMDDLLSAERVFFYGSGGSGILAMDAHHKFLRTGMETHAYTDSHLQLMSASQLREGDLAVVISHTGSNKDILDIVDVAKSNGARVLAITNFAKSPLTKSVDLSLYTVAQETEFRSEALASRIAGLTLIDSLFVNYSIKKKEQAKASTQKMRNAISRKRM
ncbi:MurR/RpiR family transcriptional regulator [Halobacillus halophilus]|uniref:RpiR family transcription regulator n=1 Tax=Halobacillus halophilus (strain ATCC 35676 / DSM 2266 / JCM 20832 / KCTC 3685 / LMG 17431 / NBRC 102448 / NCIMB 2269) TaxID=866895 RepID=I0JRT1_HALH3|nr:MurR/RpiR family transcriptional regulator [Halobacillus halophilus]ASF40807.1 MurR/RpiR family transcriptional regulator [Halobacillus halophilus]CCG46852.1 RpiR family transcription regulator [Halobacillus halophilus DSM 2266]